MAARGISNIYPNRPIFVNVTNFSDQDVWQQKGQKVSVASIASREIVDAKHECFLYAGSATASSTESMINSVY